MSDRYSRRRPVVWFVIAVLAHSALIGGAAVGLWYLATLAESSSTSPTPPEPDGPKMEVSPMVCAACPSPEPESDDELRARLCESTPAESEQVRLGTELKMCELARDTSSEGWRKAMVHWNTCCEQCTAGVDPFSGEAKACKGC